jgi:hypothetical protein
LKRLEAKVDALAKENAELRDRVRKLEPSRQVPTGTASRDKPRQSAEALPGQSPPRTLVMHVDPAHDPVDPVARPSGRDERRVFCFSH